MCFYKEIRFSRKAKRLYFGGIFLAFVIAISIPPPIPIFRKEGVESPFGGLSDELFWHATDSLYEEIKQWENLPFVDLVILTNYE